MSWSVVIPSNNAARLRRCVESILARHTIDPSKIIVVDDGARRGWFGADPAVTWVPGVSPFIYARNSNRGITEAIKRGDDVVLMGDDVLVKTPGAFDLLADTARRPKVAVVSAAIGGPVGNLLQQRRTMGAVRECTTQLCFVCVYFPRPMLVDVGELDEQFVHYGGEDVDWSWRAQDKGYRMLIDDRALVLHNEQGMASAFRTQADVAEKGQKALELLRAKWPGRST